MGPIGIPEMMAIVLIALLLFGPKKLPELGRMLGKGLTEFRRIKNEFSRTVETHMRELEREARLSEMQSSPKSISPVSDYPSSSSYSYPYEESHTDGVPAIEAAAEPISTDYVAPYESPVAGTPVNGTVARTTTDFSNAEPQHLNGAESHHSEPASEAIATRTEGNEDQRA
jgi:sec-independent protein translocase protein TatA